MQQRAGLGKTGESFLVGQDHLMRSDSYLNSKEYSVISSFRNQQQVHSPAIKSP